MKKRLDVTVEKTGLPGEPNKILISYQNTDSIWLRITPDYDSVYNSKKFRWLGWPRLQEWAVKLPASEDMLPHRVEVKVDALPAGKYRLGWSARPGFDTSENLLGHIGYHLSRLALVEQDLSENLCLGYVVDRKTGAPLGGVTIEATAQQKDSCISFMTREDGAVILPRGIPIEDLDQASIGGDRISITVRNLLPDDDESASQDTNVVFFLDKSIYRPGQTLHFKALITRSDQQNRHWQPAEGLPVTIYLQDVSHSKIDSLRLTANSFGTASGSFTIPVTASTGLWHIVCGNDPERVAVEEYRKPTFYIKWDPAPSRAVLNDSIVLSGSVITFSGIPVARADIAYDISGLRNVIRMPSGTIRTNDSGQFRIAFFATADSSDEVDKYGTRVTASITVTDKNGEQMSGQQVLYLSHNSVRLNIYKAPSILMQGDECYVAIRDAAGNSVQSDVRLIVSLLQPTPTILKKRLWEMPDQHIYDETSYRRYFPDDEYEQESDYRNWPVHMVTLDTVRQTTEDGWIKMTRAIKQQGYYRVVAQITDPMTGNILRDTVYMLGNNDTLPGNICAPILLSSSSNHVNGQRLITCKNSSGFADAWIFTGIRANSLSNMGSAHYTGKAATTTVAVPLAAEYVTIRQAVVKNNRMYKGTKQLWMYDAGYVDVLLRTHRKRLEPGMQEEWTIDILNPQRKPMRAEAVAVLYDRALDELATPQWYGAIERITHRRTGNNPDYGYDNEWSANSIGETANASASDYVHEVSSRWIPIHLPELFSVFNTDRWGGKHRPWTLPLEFTVYSTRVSRPPLIDFKRPGGRTTVIRYRSEESGNNDTDTLHGILQEKDLSPKAANIRRNFTETAFFEPHLQTDKNGSIHLKFTMPDALTEWRFRLFAHTQDLKVGWISDTVFTRKPLMVQPALPRFLRQNDDITLQTKIASNDRQGTRAEVWIDLLDPASGKNLNHRFGVNNRRQFLSADSVANATVSWKAHIPEDLDAVLMRMSVRCGHFTDAEEHVIPILSDKIPVTETLPLWMDGNGDKTFAFRPLLAADSIPSITHQRLTVSYSPDAAWSVLQTLPYLINYPYQCAEQSFNRYLACVLASSIQKGRPRLQQAIEDAAASLRTEKNTAETSPGFTSLLAEEAPWTLEETGRSGDRKNMAMLADDALLEATEQRMAGHLNSMILPDSSLPWFPGMSGSRAMTLYVATGLQKLEYYKLPDMDIQINPILQGYLMKQLIKDHQERMKQAKPADQWALGDFHINMLYNLGLRKELRLNDTEQQAVDFYASLAEQYWTACPPGQIGRIALGLHRLGRRTNVPAMIRSLRELASADAEQGVYWAAAGPPGWGRSNLETQCIMIECFTEVAHDTSFVATLQKWLLQQKRGQSWHTTRASADACFALLISSGISNNIPAVDICMDSLVVRNDTGRQDGHMYFVLPGKNIKSSMGRIHLKVRGAGPSFHPGIGAVSWQYLQKAGNIRQTGDASLSIERRLYKIAPDNSLEAVDISKPLHQGDHIIVRLWIHASANMDYVHIKDSRPSCMEPVQVHSGYRREHGLGFYESTRDASTSYFIEHLPAGTYQLDYPAYIMASGRFSSGPALIESMYAPELTAHSESLQLTVSAD